MGSPLRLPLCSQSCLPGRDVDVVHNWLSQLKEGHAVHERPINELPVYKTNNSIHLYAKRGSMLDARRLFDRMPERNVASWNIMILGYAKLEQGALALELYARMHLEGFQPNDRTFVSALTACSSLAVLEESKQIQSEIMKIGCLAKGRAIHSQVLKNSFESDGYVGASLVTMYSKCGSIEDARRVFDELPHRNVVTWTTMILSYAEQENSRFTLELYAQMHQEGVQPNDRTFLGALKACSSLAVLEEGVEGKSTKMECLMKGRAIHSQVVKSAVESDAFVGTTLVTMYAKCGSIEDAWCVFDELPHRNEVTYNTMILGYAEKEISVLALELYARMDKEGVQLNDRTFVGALKACGSLAAVEEGKQVEGKLKKVGCLTKGRTIHSQVVKRGCELDVFVGNTLMNMYAKCESMEDAICVFDELPHHNVVTWTTMILGCAEQEEGALGLELYAQMHWEGVQPNDRTFVGALKACSSLVDLEEGKQVEGKSMKAACLVKGRAIHSQIVRSGFESDAFVGNTLVNMYTKFESMEDARCVFDKLPHHDLVTWTTMILGYAKQEESWEAFRLFAHMQDKGLSPNIFTFVAILKACGNLGALGKGKELHSQICRLGFESVAIVASSLIRMYSKCGSMVHAQQLFNALPTREVVTWNTLIAGYTRQGESELVFHFFEKMRQEGIQANGITFLNVFAVCNHVGLLNKGQKYFEIMRNHYSVTLSIDHYTCIVDLLGRAGRVDEAVAMVEKMPFRLNVDIWLTVLGACRNWKNVELGRHAFENLTRLDGRVPAAYVLMADIYADANMQECEEIERMQKFA